MRRAARYAAAAALPVAGWLAHLAFDDWENAANARDVHDPGSLSAEDDAQPVILGAGIKEGA